MEPEAKSPSIWPSHIEYIGAERAKELYDLRVPWEGAISPALGFKNRRPDYGTIQGYAQAMLRGEWIPNPDALKLSFPDEDGRVWLVDGQQRMLAVGVAANTNPDIRVPFNVVENVDPKVFGVLDTGRKRTNTQVLGMKGVTNYTLVGSALRYLWMLDSGVPQAKWRQYEKLPNALLLHLLETTYPTLPDDSHRITYAGFSVGISKVSMLLWHYNLRRMFPEVNEAPEEGKPSMLDEFLTDLRTGADLPSLDPVLALRNFALGARKPKTGPRFNPERQMRITMPMFWWMLLNRSWNSRIIGQEITRPSWRAGQVIPAPISPTWWANATDAERRRYVREQRAEALNPAPMLVEPTTKDGPTEISGPVQ